MEGSSPSLGEGGSLSLGFWVWVWRATEDWDLGMVVEVEEKVVLFEVVFVVVLFVEEVVKGVPSLRD